MKTQQQSSRWRSWTCSKASHEGWWQRTKDKVTPMAVAGDEAMGEMGHGQRKRLNWQRMFHLWKDWIFCLWLQTSLHNMKYEGTWKKTATTMVQLTADSQELTDIPTTLWAKSKYDVGLIKQVQQIETVPKSESRPCKDQYPLKPEATEGMTPVFGPLLKAGIIVPCDTSQVNIYSEKDNGGGAAERENGTLKDWLTKCADTGLSWTKALPLVLTQMRARTHNLSPFEILFGRPMNTGVGAAKRQIPVTEECTDEMLRYCVNLSCQCSQFNPHTGEIRFRNRLTTFHQQYMIVLTRRHNNAP